MALDVLITGANRGIGLELARQMSMRGDRVIATTRNPDAADKLRDLDVRVEGLDVTSADQTAGLVAALEHTALDVLINNAGIGVRGGQLGTLDYDRLMDFFDTNALGALRLTEALLPHLRRGQTRKVMQITSLMGSVTDNTSGGSYGYRASKAALNMLIAASRSIWRPRDSPARCCTQDGYRRAWAARPLRRQCAKASPGSCD